MKVAQYEVLGNNAKRHIRDGSLFKTLTQHFVRLLSSGPCGTDFSLTTNKNPDRDLLS